MRHADAAIPGSLTSESLTVLAEGEEGRISAFRNLRGGLQRRHPMY
jgi:hypothetical protein